MEAYASLVARSYLGEIEGLGASQPSTQDLKVDGDDTLLPHLTGLALRFYQTQEDVREDHNLDMEDLVEACQRGDALRAKMIWDAIETRNLDLHPLISYAAEVDCPIAALLIGEIEPGYRDNFLYSYLIGEDEPGVSSHTERELEWILPRISLDVLSDRDLEDVYQASCHSGSQRLVLWTLERGVSQSQCGLRGFMAALEAGEEMARWHYGLGGQEVPRREHDFGKRPWLLQDEPSVCAPDEEIETVQPLGHALHHRASLLLWSMVLP